MAAIRPIHDGDVAALVPMKAAVHALHVVARPDFFKPMAPASVATWLRARLAEEHTHGWLAEEEGIPLGYLLAARRERGETPYSVARAWLEIDEVWIEASARRRGLARALIERAAEQAHDDGLVGLELTTWTFNEGARAAFAVAGFEPMIGRFERKLPTT